MCVWRPYDERLIRFLQFFCFHKTLITKLTASNNSSFNLTVFKPRCNLQNSVEWVYQNTRILFVGESRITWGNNYSVHKWQIFPFYLDFCVHIHTQIVSYVGFVGPDLSNKALTSQNKLKTYNLKRRVFSACFKYVHKYIYTIQQGLQIFQY